MSEYIKRHGSIMQDAEYEGIMPPDIVEQMTRKHSAPMPENEDYSPNGGSSLPSGAFPHQQLVTDGEGVAKWEDKAFYEAVEYVPFEHQPIKRDSNSREIYDDFRNLDTVFVRCDGIIYELPVQHVGWYTLEDGITEEMMSYAGNGDLIPYDVEKIHSDVPFVVYASTQYELYGSCIKVLYEDDAEHIVEVLVESETIKPLDPKYLPSSVPVIQTAAVGQTVVVKAMDENGRPTEWEASDMNVLTSPNGTKYNLTVSDDGTLTATAAT